MLQKIYVVAFILENNKVLIAKRSEAAKLFPGYYELPGGKVEFGEKPESALARELKEELNADIEVLHQSNCQFQDN